MKKKVIVSLLLVAAIMILSAVSFHTYVSTTQRYENIQLENTDLLPVINKFIVYVDHQMNPDHNHLIFNKNIPDENKNEIISYYENVLNKNPMVNGMYYKVVNTSNDVIIDNTTSKKQKYALNLQLDYDQNGVLHIKKDKYKYYNLFSSFTLDSLINLNEETEADIINSDSVKIDNPRNLSIQIMIPQQVTNKELVSLINNVYMVFNKMFITLSLCSLLLLIIIWVIPISILEDLNPYKTVKDWYLLVNTVIISIAVSVLAILIQIFIKGGIRNYFGPSIYIGDTQLHIILYILLMIVFVFVSITAFGLKYIVCYGVIDYLKDHTFIHSLYKYVLSRYKLLTTRAITDQNQKTLALTCLLTIVFFILLSFIPVLGKILMIGYGLAVFYYLSNRLVDMQTKYNKIIEQTNRMIEGEFEEITEDLGSFNDLRDSLNNVKDGFKIAVEKEVSSSKMKTELISNVSHDLKTPLTCIKNYVILLQSAKDDEERKTYLKELNHYTNRMSQLIEDLFDVARVNSGEINLHLSELDIVSLLNQAIVENEEILHSKNLQIIKNTNVDMQNVYLDGEKTYRIFENLITNIGKYALKDTRVYIDLNVNDDITITFKNISEAEMNFTSEEIVERFKRGDKSRHESGSGLGLAIAKSFTEVQGGNFDLAIDGDMFKVILQFKK